MKVKIYEAKFKFYLYDEFGKPVDKFRGTTKDITKRLRGIIKKYS